MPTEQVSTFGSGGCLLIPCHLLLYHECPMEKTHYEVLEVSENADQDAIKDAYRTLSMVWHPDRLSHSEELQAKAKTKQQEINAAYAILRDASKRAAYDGDLRWRRNHENSEQYQQAHEGRGSGNSDPASRGPHNKGSDSANERSDPPEPSQEDSGWTEQRSNPSYTTPSTDRTATILIGLVLVLIAVLARKPLFAGLGSLRNFLLASAVWLGNSLLAAALWTGKLLLLVVAAVATLSFIAAVLWRFRQVVAVILAIAGLGWILVRNGSQSQTPTTQSPAVPAASSAPTINSPAPPQIPPQPQASQVTQPLSETSSTIAVTNVQQVAPGRIEASVIPTPEQSNEATVAQSPDQRTEVPRQVATNGTMIWSGEVFQDMDLVIDAGTASTGVLQGDLLPGVPCTITKISDPTATILEAPTVQNQFRRLSLHFKRRGKQRITIVVCWAVPR